MRTKFFGYLATGAFCVCLPITAKSSELTEQQSRVQSEIARLLETLPEQQRAAVLARLAPKDTPTKPKISAAPATTAFTAMASAPSAQKPKNGQAQPDQGPVAAFLGQNASTDTPYQKSGCQGFGFVLRQDWKDMGFAPCPDTVDKATGAQISYTNDQVAKNTIWATHGTAAILYNANIPNLPDAYSLSRIGFGGYATGNRLTNSSVSKIKSNSDSSGYGGLAVFALATPVDMGWTNWIRAHGGMTEDHLKNTTAASVEAEWFPVNPNFFIHRPFQPFGLPTIIRLDPEFIVQYDSATGKKQSLGFNNLGEALRIGPQLSVLILPPPGVSDFLARFHGNVSYHYMYETYAQKDLRWFDSSVTFNLDPAGNFGLTGSYSRGQDEMTGADTNLYKLSLSGKI